MVKRRRAEIAKIAGSAARPVMCPERRESPFKEASELCRPCGALAPPAAAAAAAFSTAGEPCSFGDPSAGAIISEHIRGDGRVAPPMGVPEWVDWCESKWGSSATGEDVGSLIAKYDAVRDRVGKKLEDLEKDSSVSIGAGDSGAGFGRNSDNLSVFESFEARVPALFEDCLCDSDGDAFLTLPENSAAGGGSLGVDSTPICSHLVGCGFDPDNFLSVSGDRVSDGDRAIGGGSSGEEPMLRDECGFNPDEFISLLEDCAGDCDRDSFLTLPENSAIGGGGSSGEEPMLCDECGFNPDEFLSLLEDCAGDGDCDSFLTLPENSAIGGGGSSGEEPMLCNLEECGFNPDEFLSLLEDCVDDGDRDSFLTLPENSAIGGGGSSGEEPTLNLEECGFNPDEFLGLLEDCVDDGDRGSFLTLPENSAIIGGGSSAEGEETMLCDLEGYANHVLALEDLDVPL